MLLLPALSLGLSSCRPAAAPPAAGRPAGVPILMYHRIGEEGSDKWWVSRATFEAQLAWFRDQGYTSILPRDLLAAQTGDATLPARPILFTFDDGYENVVTAAEPLLAKYGFRGIVYLPTAFIAETAAERRSLEGVPCLVWPEIRAARARGVLEFGAHGRAHKDLRLLDDPAAEIRGCREDFRRGTGVEPDSFCYPFGRYLPETVALVHAAGFSTGITCDQALAKPGRALDPYRLPRVHVIGGRHDFTAAWATGAGIPRRRAGVRIEHRGESLAVVPCLVGPGIRGGRVRGEAVRLGAGSTLLTWEASAVRRREGVRLELMDVQQVFPYFEASL